MSKIINYLLKMQKKIMAEKRRIYLCVFELV